MIKDYELKYPIQLEIIYENYINSLTDPVFKAFEEDSDFFEKVISDYRKTLLLDSFNLDGWTDFINSKITEYKKKFSKTKKEIKESASKLFNKIEKFNNKEIKKFVEKAVGASVLVKEKWKAGLKKAFEVTNINLIQSVQKELLDQVQFKLMEGVTAGKPWEEIRDEILRKQKLKGIPSSVRIKIENRARRIAQDQVQKAYGILVKNRGLERGIYGYKWQTMEDKKVRPSHARQNQKYYLFPEAYALGFPAPPYYRKTPPVDQFPSWGYNCRCSAILDSNWLTMDFSKKNDSLNGNIIEFEQWTDTKYIQYEAIV